MLVSCVYYCWSSLKIFCCPPPFPFHIRMRRRTSRHLAAISAHRDSSGYWTCPSDPEDSLADGSAQLRKASISQWQGDAASVKASS